MTQDEMMFDITTLIENLKEYRKYVYDHKILRDSLNLCRKQVGQQQRQIIKLEEEVDKWKSLYINEKRPIQNLMSSQNAIGKTDNAIEERYK